MGYYYDPDTGGLKYRPPAANPLAPTLEELEAKAVEFARGWSIEPTPVFYQGIDQDDEDDFAKASRDAQHWRSARCPHCGHGEYGLQPPDFETARCMKCNRNFPVEPPSPPEAEPLAKAAGEPHQVQNPGARGGKFFVDKRGVVRYGAQPPPRAERRPVQVQAKKRARKVERRAAKPGAPRRPAPSQRKEPDYNKESPFFSPRDLAKRALPKFKANYESLRHRAMKLVGEATKPKLVIFRTALKVGHTWARFEHYCRKRGLEADELVIHAMIELPHLAHLADSVVSAVGGFFAKSDDVLAPGSRGGKWFRNARGKVQYGDPPEKQRRSGQHVYEHEEHARAGRMQFSEAFRNWFGRSKVVNADGSPRVVYRGDKRGDLLGNKYKINRATSGRFYFTDDPAIASSYAVNKDDIKARDDIQEAGDFRNWYQFPPDPGTRTPNNLRSQWYRLTPEQKRRVLEQGPTVEHDEEHDKYVLGDGICSRDHWDYTLREHGGNGLMALADIWMDSGNLYDDEERFGDILDLVGVTDWKFNSPWHEQPVVSPVYLSIQNPLNTSALPENVIETLRRVAKSDRTRGKQYGMDQWDKTTHTPREWFQRLEEDIREGTTYAWTSIPEKITHALMQLGYDGIQDTGGKHSGNTHTVWIAFRPNQIKSATGNKGTFDFMTDDITKSVFAKSEQLGLFGEPRKPVQRPGIRGGKWYLDKHFQVRYGEPPHGARTFPSEDAAQAAVAAGPVGEHEELAEQRRKWAEEGAALDATSTQGGDIPPPPDVPPDRPPSGGGGDDDDGGGPDEQGPPAEPLWLGPDGMAWLDQRVSELVKRARRIGVVEPNIRVIATEMRREAVNVRDGRDRGKPFWVGPSFQASSGVRLTGAVREYKQVEIDNPEVKLEGWTFLGTIEHDVPDEPDLVRTVPGKTIPVEYRTRGNVCDHCQHQRRRSETFILQHDDGRTRQVGRTCLADFLGHPDAERLANAAAIYGDLGGLLSEAALYDEDEEGGGGGDRGEVYADTATFLSYAALAVRLWGFISKKAAMETADTRHPLRSTADAALDLMFPPKKQNPNDPDPPRPEDRDREQAEKWRAWALALPAGDIEKSDYLYNLHTLASRDVMRPFRHSGLLASLSAAYDRAMGVERERSEKAATSEFLGTVGERLVIRQVTIDKVIEREGDYGTTYIHKMHDAAGNQLTWFGSKLLRVPDDSPDHKGWDYWMKPGWVEEKSPQHGQVVAFVTPDGTRHEFPERPTDFYKMSAEEKAPWIAQAEAFDAALKEGRIYKRDAEEGDTLDVIATVKKHEEFRGVKQTVITRVAELDPEQQAKLAAKEAKAAAKAAKAAEKAAKQAGKLAKASWGARLMKWAKSKFAKAADPAAGHRYVTVHKGGPDTPGETIRMVPDQYNPGIFDVHEEDRERAGSAFKPAPAAPTAGKPGAKPTGKPMLEGPEDRRKKRAKLIAKLVEELVVGENGAITQRGGR